MSAMNCASCGSGNLILGTMQSTGALRFRPVNAKFVTLRTADISLDAKMCPQCGHIAVFGDVEKLLQIHAPSETEKTAAPTAR